MADALCYGDLIIDFVPLENGQPLGEVTAFARAAGGAAANVAVGLARLGIKSAFMGKVGDDPFGRFLAKTLEEDGVDTGPLRFEARARTALAFVSLRADGERDFMFYKHPSADHFFVPEEIDEDAIRSSRVFHFDSLTMIKPTPRGTALAAVAKAKAAGCTLSYDVNLRLPLWEGDEDGARAVILAGIAEANIAKMSEEELHFLTGKSEPEAMRDLLHDDLRLGIVTQGGRGSLIVRGDKVDHVPSFKVAPVDTTGAGDGFVAGLLAGLIEKPEALDDDGALHHIVRFANAVGALATTGRGAIPSLPRRAAVEDLMRRAAP